MNDEEMQKRKERLRKIAEKERRLSNARDFKLRQQAERDAQEKEITKFEEALNDWEEFSEITWGGIIRGSD